ncbi:MAG TPA: MFS transporter [Candidatus Baltobacteraceae bacterium]|nr:MFS transporter [Candidatus Baltobacteraceae bacterium]
MRVANGGTFLFNASNALFLLFPVYLQQMRASPTQIGLVAGLLRAGSLIARPLGGQLLDRFGRRKILWAGALCLLVGILSLFVFPRMGLAFFGFRLLQGAGTSLLDSGFGAVVADLSPPAARAQMFAIYTIWINVANAVMPAIGEAVVRRFGFVPLFGCAAALVIGCAYLIGRLPETARRRPAGPVALSGILASTGPLLLGGMLVGWTFGTLATFVPVTRIAAGPGRVGLFFFAYSGGLIAMRAAASAGLTPPVHPKILLPGYGVLAVGLALLPLGTSGLRLVLVGIGCGAAQGLIMPVIYALLLVGLPRDRRGWGVALMAAAYDLGVVVASVGLGLVAEGVGIRGIFLVAAVGVMLFAGIAQAWARR